MTINQYISIAEKHGFEQYGDFREEDNQHLIMTATKGVHSGEVIDLYYDFNSGRVLKAEVTSQFPEFHPHYKPVSFSFRSFTHS